LGVISQQLFTMMVIMALVTTCMTTPLLHWIHPTLAPEPGGEDSAGKPPPAEQAKPFTVLMCIAQAHSGPGMAVLSKALTGTAAGSRLLALRLIGPPERTSDYLHGTATDLPMEGNVVLAPLAERTRELG